MPKYAIHTDAGEILRVLDIPAEHIDLQLSAGEYALEVDAQPHHRIDMETMQVIELPEPVPAQSAPPPELPEYVTQRQRLYPSVQEQLDLLWHAMNNNELPKAEAFFHRIKVVKDSVPKTGDADPVVIYSVDEVPEA